MLKSILRIGAGALFIAVAVFLGFQAPNLILPKIRTETVLPFTVNEKLTVGGYIIRDETVITGETGGVIDYVLGMGGRVGRGGKIADVYASVDDADRSVRIRELNANIALLESVLSTESQGPAYIARIETQVLGSLRELGALCDDGMAAQAYAMRDGIYADLARKQVILGDTAAIEGRIAQLTAERDSLSVGFAPAVQSVYAQTSGFFLDSVDGLEQALTVKNARKLSVDDMETLDSIPAQAPQSGVIGRIIEGFTWSFACVVEQKDLEGMGVGHSVTLHFPFALGLDVPMAVAAINPTASGSAVLVLESANVISELQHLRRQTVDIILESYGGLKLSRDALRIVDGVMGVYVLTGQMLTFKPIDIIYQQDSYVLIENSTTSKGVLVYDEVVVEGTDLYDGKIIN